MTYKLYKNIVGQDGAVIVNQNGSMTSFLFDENNTDYQAFLLWKAQGNTPTPEDEGTQ
jgi:hypothetical protein